MLECGNQRAATTSVEKWRCDLPSFQIFLLENEMTALPVPKLHKAYLKIRLTIVMPLQKKLFQSRTVTDLAFLWKCCWLCSQPAAEYALVEKYQFWQPTFPCWLRASWERVDCCGTTAKRLRYWANRLFYASWNRLQLIGSNVADCQALTWLHIYIVISWYRLRPKRRGQSSVASASPFT